MAAHAGRDRDSLHNLLSQCLVLILVIADSDLGNGLFAFGSSVSKRSSFTGKCLILASRSRPVCNSSSCMRLF
jgi:hypothetical protein